MEDAHDNQYDTNVTTVASIHYDIMGAFYNILLITIFHNYVNYVNLKPLVRNVNNMKIIRKTIDTMTSVEDKMISGSVIVDTAETKENSKTIYFKNLRNPCPSKRMARKENNVSFIEIHCDESKRDNIDQYLSSNLVCTQLWRTNSYVTYENFNSINNVNGAALYKLKSRFQINDVAYGCELRIKE